MEAKQKYGSEAKNYRKQRNFLMSLWLELRSEKSEAKRRDKQLIFPVRVQNVCKIDLVSLSSKRTFVSKQAHPTPTTSPLPNRALE